MNVKELRIGNYCNIEGKLNEINLADFYDIYTVLVDFKTYTPIKLTEEWLEKFGFCRHESNWFFALKFDENLETFKLTPLYSDDKPDGFFGLLNSRACVNKFKYVHELQNLFFALTGQELEFESEVSV